ncbi:hypothetical protein Asppvi_002014 [Aspergillus pseudoviridinutans]|uniref:Uncharacterized protein n=1 Tax=Aspergillus pseudoviridinutans TaxID=1517512 RepID=A0A9P3BS91_9EURO|nr:uncharacterized protein Asppvi_002014 [Aspergillus pseudoviridinutans]GIJ92736.1 hypothetical protein Asppvi_002014 [Aspergillus pseudoviridinutans]
MTRRNSTFNVNNDILLNSLTSPLIRHIRQTTGQNLRENFRAGVAVFKGARASMSREEVYRWEEHYMSAFDLVTAYVKALESGVLVGKQLEVERERVFTRYAEAMNGLEGWTVEDDFFSGAPGSAWGGEALLKGCTGNN